MRLILATSNGHKIRELRALLKGVAIDLYSLMQFPEYQPPEETGGSFEENASLKAFHAARALGGWVLSDDSGLCVPALGGAPGIYSARYAGVGASDKEKRQKLLQEMISLEGIARSAYFECVLALAKPEGVEALFKGRCEGSIVTKERGRNGFGYDPVFMKHDYQKTFAELDESIKNCISHRAKAFAQFKDYLQMIA